MFISASVLHVCVQKKVCLHCEGIELFLSRMKIPNAKEIHAISKSASVWTYQPHELLWLLQHVLSVF